MSDAHATIMGLSRQLQVAMDRNAELSRAGLTYQRQAIAMADEVQQVRREIAEVRSLMQAVLVLPVINPPLPESTPDMPTGIEGSDQIHGYNRGWFCAMVAVRDVLFPQRTLVLSEDDAP